jgi:hypothetical protein
MSDLKENFDIQVETAKLRAAEAGLSFGSYFRSFPAWKRRLLYLMLILIIPGYVVVRYGVEQAVALRLKQQVLSAHPSFSTTEEPTIGSVRVLSLAPGQYAAYAEVQNNNLDLAADNVPYTFHFNGSTGGEAVSSGGTLFLLPNQKKYVVASRVDSAVGVSSATLELGEIKWQKKLDMPTVELKTPESFLSEEINPLRLTVEGSVVNNSPYQLGTVKLVFLLYNSAGNVIAVSQRDEFRVSAFGRRSYVQQWPGLYKTDVAKIVTIADTNTLDGNNVMIDQTAPSDLRDIQGSQNNGF